MKLLLFLIVVAFVAAGSIFGQSAKQNEKAEQEIRKLEAAEGDAILRSDVEALKKLWAKSFTVNNPQNQIVRGSEGVFELIRKGVIKYSSFVREVEAVVIDGNTAIAMGSETVKPIGTAPDAGQTVYRRYTDIWMKKQGKWLLTARHANIICQH